MNPVENMRVVEIREILVGKDEKGRVLTKTKIRKMEVTQERADKLLDKYGELEETQEGVQAEGARDLGQCYETMNGKVREIYGELELNPPAQEKSKRGSKK